MTEHRRPPLSPKRPGWCRWCDEPVGVRLKKDGMPHKTQGTWHGECSDAWWAASNLSRNIPALIKRDGPGCNGCDIGHDSERLNYDPEVDHKIPLWKVRHLPDGQRRWFFGIENLWLLCGLCHKRKSAKEAAERAHLKRLDGPKKPPRVKMQGRAFPKDRRRRMDGKVERRT